MTEFEASESKVVADRDIDVGGNRIINLGEPISDNDVIRKQDLPNIISYETGHSEWGELEEEEVHKIQVESDETVKINRLEFSQKDETDVDEDKTIEIINTDDNSIIDSVDLNEISKEGGTGTEGVNVSVRITTNEDVDATIRVIGEVV